MNAQTKKPEGVALNVHRKLSMARQKFHATKLKKSGHNKFAGYKYFELGDFLIPALAIFDEIGLGTVTSFNSELATMVVVDLDNPSDTITITSPMSEAKLKACHEVQNVGAVETYQRRYLWQVALEIVEHDALDAVTGKDEPEAEEKPALINDETRDRIIQLCEAVGGGQSGVICNAYKVESLADLTPKQGEAVISRLNEKLDGKVKQKESA